MMTLKPIAVLGIDPGLKGGIALISPGLDYVEVLAMPTAGAPKRDINIQAVCQTINKWRETFKLQLAILEQVHAMPKQGVTSMFTFGKGYGMIIGMLMALQVPFELVQPTTWKKQILTGTKKDKSAAVQYCLARFPSISITPARSRVPHDGMADALCLAAFAEWKVT